MDIEKQRKLQSEIDALDNSIDNMKKQHERELAPLVESRAAKENVLMDLLATPYGVKRGQKRAFSEALADIFRTPSRDWNELEINRFRAGFVIFSIYSRNRLKLETTIETLDRSGGTGGIPIEVVAKCELIVDS